MVRRNPRNLECRDETGTVRANYYPVKTMSPERMFEIHLEKAALLWRIACPLARQDTIPFRALD